MTSTPSYLRAQVHYSFALLVIGFYGVQVCPFIESLSVLQLASPIAAILLLQYALHRWIIGSFIDKSRFKVQVKRTFQSEWAIFLFSGVLLTTFNTLVHDFPALSGFKVMLGFLSVGFFVAIDLSLERELNLAKHMHAENISLNPDKSFFTLVNKFSLFSTMTILFLVSIFFLLISKDLEWMSKISANSASMARRSVLIEFAFVGSILLAYTLVVINSYARNLKYFFNSENHVLGDVSSGHLDRAVTVSTNDEFGVMAQHTNSMIRSLQERTQELQRTQDVTILSLASLAETRDNETGAHILRTQYYVRALAIALSQKPKFKDQLDEEIIDLLYKSAPLHDIGKVGIPDAILLKPGKLDEAEFEIMKTHTSLGDDALKLAEAEHGACSFLRYAKEIALTHHEKWDGSGYPKGLIGDAIPLSGRLMAVADVYDALISKRVYKPAFSHEKAMEIIQEGRGSHFDPDIVDAFFSIEMEVKSIAERYSDDAYRL